MYAFKLFMGRTSTGRMSNVQGSHLPADVLCGTNAFASNQISHKTRLYLPVRATLTHFSLFFGFCPNISAFATCHISQLICAGDVESIKSVN